MLKNQKKNQIPFPSLLAYKRSINHDPPYATGSANPVVSPPVTETTNTPTEETTTEPSPPATTLVTD